MGRLGQLLVRLRWEEGPGRSRWLLGRCKMGIQGQKKDKCVSKKGLGQDLSKIQ